MNTLKFVFAVLVAVIVAGCGTIITVAGDPNRPFPPQPAVSEKVRNELALKKMQEIKVFVSSRIKYYDGTNAMKIMVEVEKSGRKATNFTRDFPPLENPSSETVTNSRGLLGAFKNHLKDIGFSVTETPCDMCLTVIADYTEFWEKSAIFFAVGTKVYYRGEEVLVSRDDRMSGWRSGLATLPFFFKKTVGIISEEMLEAWNANIATASRQKISAATQ